MCAIQRFKSIFFLERTGMVETALMMNKFYRKPTARIARSNAGSMLPEATGEVIGNAGIQGAVTTQEYIEIPRTRSIKHERI